MPTILLVTSSTTFAIDADLISAFQPLVVVTYQLPQQHLECLERLLQDDVLGVWPVNLEQSEQLLIATACQSAGKIYFASSIPWLVLASQRDIVRRLAMTHGMLTSDFHLVTRQDSLSDHDIQLPCKLYPGGTCYYDYVALRQAMTQALRHYSVVRLEHDLAEQSWTIPIFGSRQSAIVLPARSDQSVLSPTAVATLQNLARRTLKMTDGQAVAEITFSYNPETDLFHFIELNPQPVINATSLFTQAAQEHGWELATLVKTIMRQLAE